MNVVKSGGLRKNIKRRDGHKVELGVYERGACQYKGGFQWYKHWAFR